MEKEIDKILLSLDIEPDKSKVEYKGLLRKWVELKLMRTNWKRELINQTGKTDDDFRKEVDEKWKIDLFTSESNESPQVLTEPVEIKLHLGKEPKRLSSPPRGWKDTLVLWN